MAIKSKFLKIFLEKGTIHGLPFVARGRLTVFERILWLAVTFFALYVSIHLALKSVDRFNTKSTVLSVERDYYYWNTSIASLTVCPMERLSHEKFDAYAEYRNITSKDKTELFEFLESLANSSYFNFNDIKEYASVDKHNIDPMDYMTLIYNLTDNYLTLPNEDERLKASFEANFIHSEQILTEWGICYSTNNFLNEDLSTTNLLFGKRAPYVERNNTLKVYSSNFFDGEAVYSFFGFKGPIVSYVHGVYEVMKFEKRTISTPIPFEYNVKTFDITSDENFDTSTTVAQRHCRFPHESNLTHFPVYTRNLCYQECRINLAYKLCKCIPHFYPNRGALKPVCHYKVLKNCLYKYARIFENLSEIKNLSMDNNAIQCYCLENCRSSEVLELKYQEMPSVHHLIQTGGALIIMKSYPTIRYRRQIIFTFTDLLVSIGGTAGFFLGSSVLSVIEIIYYFTFRFFWHCAGFRE